MNDRAAPPPALSQRELLRAPLDALLTDTNRLRLLAALVGLPPSGEMNFTALRDLLALTDGNLGMHLRVLIEHGYLTVRKNRRGRRVQSHYQVTPAGRATFAMHVAALEAIIAAAHAEPDGTPADE